MIACFAQRLGWLPMRCKNEFKIVSMPTYARLEEVK